jgi:hypothetical protein
MKQAACSACVCLCMCVCVGLYMCSKNLKYIFFFIGSFLDFLDFFLFFLIVFV